MPFAIALNVYLSICALFRKASTEQVFKSEKIIAHENYNERSFDNDIAIIKLERPAILNQHVKLACLPQQDYQLPASMFLLNCCDVTFLISFHC